ncbi:MAG: DUF3592 domain-containing protein [Pirellulales bacterium]|nr:DUF3592 domain-containing protein [Pirellulales bacterium]
MEVGKFFFSWAFAICEYLFFVLLLGLVCSMFATIVDVILIFVTDHWDGYGRQSGWVLGVVVGAIGLPLGWVRPNDKKFSFPTPRKLTKQLSNHVAKRRSKKVEQKKGTWDSHDFPTLGSVVKGASWCGFICAGIGFILGMHLMMCWFSLAMSPFAPGGWFDAIEFGSDSPRHHDDGMSMTTSHPIALILALAPMFVSGGVGYVGGIVYGLLMYVRYLKTVPASIRTHHHQERIAALRGKKLPWFVAVIGIVSTLVGGGLCAWAVIELNQALASRDWPQVPGRILVSKVESSEDSEGGKSYSAAISYGYAVDRYRYTGNRISFSDFASSSYRSAFNIVNRYQKGKEVPVFYNPNHPQRSVLEPGRPQGPLLLLGFSSLLLMVGFFILILGAERFMANRHHSIED